MSEMTPTDEHLALLEAIEETGGVDDKDGRSAADGESSDACRGRREFPQLHQPLRKRF